MLLSSLFNRAASPSADPSDTQNPPSSSPTSTTTTNPPPNLPRHYTNLKLLFGGVTFFALSVLVTRRAFTKRVLACRPPYYTASVYHQPPANGAGDAFEALSLATLNVCSFAMMATGGVLYALDVASLEDMRRYVKKEMGEGTVRDEAVEKEVEQWVEKVLGEKFGVELKKEKEKEKEKERAREKDVVVSESEGGGNGEK
ncbi:uncharacterized protein ACLA_035480 [Aspergillus clavatus NRRL 1]|uniref:Altered inheritance of mitochondria protein 11 n=1 Tax=Aspergillus clavatus (strain ATCC 1007 / CBS 513.65 / DSM 816 / NCTC 3887 / NRRL 1 / QM 1276 / 107) TaxID=344612 RepID=A1CJM1_ASPCL|nr:uncharacterized protein ACLA_035480 [Aspergillus clavatus NRRL 1]EAW09345.1 conserved hypothetical protein [Aspergillus clavatus NRRL 1]